MNKCVQIFNAEQNDKKASDYDIPKIFWKYFDSFRRGKLSLSDFSQMSGIKEQTLLDLLQKL